jgi:protein-L-isoaspartate(D-aspartate) O-methyltransferase
MVTTDIASVRREFVNRITNLAGVRSCSLIEAFAAVPRENFLGPGPWQTMRSPFAGGYTDTPDANPIHLYDTVVVALDSSRHLNNGEPTGLATWLDRIGTAPGVRFLHVGCGVGYYTAEVAHAVSPQGTVLALEADAGLAERAKRNLAGYANVEVRCATEANSADEPFDAIFVNAGAARRCSEGTLEWCRVSGAIATNQNPSAGYIVRRFACR